MAKVMLDAGHGGSDAGASHEGRLEKDDVLRLVQAVGEILDKNGAETVYTRENDTYSTPYEKAMSANSSGADVFVSLHRNSTETPNISTGVVSLVYQDDGVRAELARNINEKVSEVGFRNLGVVPRPNLVVLRRTMMPAVMVELGFINSDADNQLFDEKFDQLAQAVADGIMGTLEVMEVARIPDIVPSGSDYEIEVEPPVSKQDMEGRKQHAHRFSPFRRPLFRVQVGAFRNYQNAARFLAELHKEEYPAFILYQDGLFRVQVGAYQILDNAIRMEKKLREQGYNTFVVY